MLAQSHARKPAPPLAARGMWLRLHGGADAFGSVLGDAIVGSIQRGDANKVPAGAVINYGDADMDGEAHKDWGAFSRDTKARAAAREADTPDWARPKAPTPSAPEGDEPFDFRWESLEANARRAVEEQTRVDGAQPKDIARRSAAKAQAQSSSAQAVTAMQQAQSCSSIASCKEMSTQFARQAETFGKAAAYYKERGDLATSNAYMKAAIDAGLASCAASDAVRAATPRVSYGATPVNAGGSSYGAGWSYLGANSSGMSSMTLPDNRTQADIDKGLTRVTNLIAGAPVTMVTLAYSAPVSGSYFALGAIAGGGTNAAFQYVRNDGDVSKINWTDVTFAGVTGGLTFGKSISASLPTNTVGAFNNASINGDNPVWKVTAAATGTYAGAKVGDLTQKTFASLAISNAIGSSNIASKIYLGLTLPSNGTSSSFISESIGWGFDLTQAKMQGAGK